MSTNEDFFLRYARRYVLWIQKRGDISGTFEGLAEAFAWFQLQGYCLGLENASRICQNRAAECPHPITADTLRACAASMLLQEERTVSQRSDPDSLTLPETQATT